MKNITIKVSEDVARWARVYAAKNNTSVSRLLGEMLRERMLLEEDYETATQRFLDRDRTPLKAPGDRYPKRDELYER